MTNEQEMEQGTMLSWISGSTLHGLRNEHSDIDTRIVRYDRRDALLAQEHTIITHDAERDISIIPLHSFITLLMKGTPNMIEGLIARGECLIAHDDIADAFSARHREFTTRRTLSSMMGMARSNIAFITKHPHQSARKTAKTQCEIIRELRIGRLIATEGTLHARIDAHGLTDIKNGAFMTETGMSDSWEAFLSHELDLTKTAEANSTIRERPTEELAAWCRSMLMKANMRTLGI